MPHLLDLFGSLWSLSSPAVPSPPRAPAWLIPLFLLGPATTTLFAVNAGAGSVYGRMEDMAVWLHRSYYGNSHYRLSGNLSTIADPAAQERERVRVLERLRAQTYPDDREVALLWEKLGRQRAERQEFAAALDAYRQALRVEPSRWSRLGALSATGARGSRGRAGAAGSATARRRDGPLTDEFWPDCS